MASFDPRAVFGKTEGDSDDDRNIYDLSNSNAIALPGKKTRKTTRKVETQPEPKKVLSKSKQKRLAKLEEQRAKKARRADLMATLAKNNLSQAELELIRSSKVLGQKDTLKQRLTRALREERAGIAQSVEVGLYKERGDEKAEDTEEEVVTSEEDEDGDVVAMDQEVKDVEKSDGAARPSTKRPVADTSNSAIVEPKQKKKTTSVNMHSALVDPLASTPKLIVPKASPAKKAFYVKLQRHHKIAAARMELPVVGEEQAIMEAISENDVVIICGETGSGKTTQVPQFLYEAGYSNKESGKPGMIGVTQPRRVATVSMAKRVAEELGSTVSFGKQVAYQIRYDTNLSNKTQVKFMTDGVLLKEMQSDFLLRKYSALILDEAHERNINTDILIGLLSRVVPLRAEMAAEQEKKRRQNPQGSGDTPLTPLKLIIMSATLRVSDFTENTTLFGTPPPVINVNARQYPVVTHFARRTNEVDYADEAMKKVIRIHKKLPPGGILVFLTGAQEIEIFCSKLRSKFSRIAAKRKNREAAAKADDCEREEGSIAEVLKLKNAATDESVQPIDVGEWNFGSGKKASASVAPLQEDDLVVGGDGTIADLPAEVDDIVYDGILSDEDENEGGERADGAVADDDEDDDGKFANVPVCVLPLYSMLAPEKQMKVFEAEKILTRARLVVVATNVAETSITIPGIKYVVDTGKHKERLYGNRAGLSRFDINWISKASADQRSGRAGRTGPGHCYRLYSSAVFDRQFPQFSDPEILKAPIESIVLQLKTMGIERVDRFPFPTPPDEDSVASADKLLVNIGAIDSETKKITSLGRTLANFPINPRFAKMLLVGDKDGCLAHTVALVAAMSVRDPFIRALYSLNNADGKGEDADDAVDLKDDFDSDDDEEMDEAAARARQDAQKRAAAAMEKWFDEGSDLLAVLNAYGAYVYAGCSRKFCIDNALHAKTMSEIHQLYKQLARIVNGLLLSNAEKVPSAKDALSSPPTTTQRKTLRQIIAAGFVDQVVRVVPREQAEDRTRAEYIVTDSDDRVYLHPGSFVKGRERHEFLVYNELIETRRPYIKGVTVIDPEWLPDLCPPQTTFSKVMDAPPPNYDSVKDECYWFVTPTYGKHQWPVPIRRVVIPSGLTRIKYFARFFLEGRVFPGSRDIKGVLNENPAIITKDWAKPKIAAFTQQLVDHNIDCRSALIKQWEKDRNFLLPAMLMWTQNAHKKKVASQWPLKHEPVSKGPKRAKGKDEGEGTVPQNFGKAWTVREPTADSVENEL